MIFIQGTLRQLLPKTGSLSSYYALNPETFSLHRLGRYPQQTVLPIPLLDGSSRRRTCQFCPNFFSPLCSSTALQGTAHSTHCRTLPAPRLWLSRASSYLPSKACIQNEAYTRPRLLPPALTRLLTTSHRRRQSQRNMRTSLGTGTPRSAYALCHP